jgi:hypothetical protein
MALKEMGTSLRRTYFNLQGAYGLPFLRTIEFLQCTSNQIHRTRIDQDQSKVTKPTISVRAIAATAAEYPFEIPLATPFFNL